MDDMIRQRVDNEIEVIKRAMSSQLEEEDDFPYQIFQNNIEHLPEYKIVRVDFMGFNASHWANCPFNFEIKYHNYPLEPPIVQFPKEIRHQQIVQNTGVFCIPQLSPKLWKASTRLMEIITIVIKQFHDTPLNSVYPVDFSILVLFENNDEYQEYIKDVKSKALQWNQKIQLERQIESQRKKN